MNVKEFIWERYDPCNSGFIRVETMIQDIIYAILISIVLIIWSKGFSLIMYSMNNPSYASEGFEVLTIICSIVSFVCVFVVSIVNVLDGEVEYANNLYHAAMQYKLFKK